MTTPSLPTVTAHSAALATFGASHGYRFNADHVALTASFNISTPAAHQRTWALQLWACPSAPATPAELQGQLVASVSLPPLAEIADPVETFTVNAVAIPPAGQGDHTMVLALVAVAANERTAGEIHDLAVYPRREIFALPRLVDGNITGSATGQVVITAGAIENPRDAGNTSGTLSLELWALNAAYNGGDFTGWPAAGIVLGTLAGQARLTGLNFPVNATLPRENSRLVLMLREWNGTRYLTRDYTNLSDIFVAPVAAVTDIAPAAAADAAPATASIAATAAIAAAKPAKKTRKSSRTATVAINTASESELIAVKGLSLSLVQAIIAGRPYAKLDDLVKVKGVGPKLLAKVRSRLRLN